MCDVQARHRWCLTGTPIQNRLEDLGALVEFLRVDPFDNPAAFRRSFLDPIAQHDGQGWERLRALVRAISLRRTKAALKTEMDLPLRQEVTCHVFLDKEERQIYDLVKRRFAMAMDSGGGQTNAFQLILRLRQICNHGVDLLPAKLCGWLQQASPFGLQGPLECEKCESCDAVLRDVDETTLEGLSCGHQICSTCRRDSGGEDLDGDRALVCPLCQRVEPSARCNEDSSLSAGKNPRFYQPSSKVRELLRNLESDKHEATKAGHSRDKRSVSPLFAIGYLYISTGV